MFKIILLIITILCIISLFFILFYTLNRVKSKLSVKKFNDRIINKQFDYLLDVRTPEEWMQGHHELAKLLPIGTFVTDLPNTIKDKNSTILIYCKKGIRAEASAKIANRLGYNNVYWMDGTWAELSKLL
jgi:rhodanese-related sulfurtransferase